MMTREFVRSVVLGAAVGVPLVFAGPVMADSESVERALPDFTELVREHSPAVVNISTEGGGGEGRTPPEGFVPDPEEFEPQSFGVAMQTQGPFEEFLERFQRGLPGQQGPEGGPPMPPEEDGRSLGSGFIISSEGAILTNHHVVQQAEEIIVRFADGREKVAEVIGSDPRSDIAVIQVDANDLPVASIGRSADLQVGEWVLAIGSPFGFEHSVTAGIVSAKGRTLPRGNYVPYIQTDVAINPGNSGGPLFNLDGEVVGVNAQIYSRSGGFMGLSFAIPIDLAMDVARQLQETGEVERGWLGVMIQDVTRELAESFGLDRPHGALVSQVMEGSPAEDAGIQSGDVILEFDGREVEDSASLPPMVGQTPIGEVVELKVLRDGEIKTLEFEVARLPDEDEMAMPGMPPGEAPAPEREDHGELGLVLEELGEEEREALDLRPDEGGLLVERVEEGPAAQAGLRPGDVILSIAQRPVDSVQAFSQIVSELPSGSTVPVHVLRNGNRPFLALEMP